MKKLRLSIFAVFVISAFNFICGCNAGIEMSEQQSPQEFGSTDPGKIAPDGIHALHRSHKGRDLGGISQRPGLSIHWAGSDRQDSSVRPEDVISVTINRLEAEQQTDLGSDRNARAMVLLMQSLDVLRETDQEIDGIPVIK